MVLIDEFGRVRGRGEKAPKGWTAKPPLDYGLECVGNGMLCVDTFWRWYDSLPIIDEE